MVNDKTLVIYNDTEFEISELLDLVKIIVSGHVSTEDYIYTTGSESGRERFGGIMCYLETKKNKSILNFYRS